MQEPSRPFRSSSLPIPRSTSAASGYSKLHSRGVFNKGVYRHENYTHATTPRNRQVRVEEELYDPGTTDVAYKTRDGRPESFQVEDEERSFTPGYLDVAYETEDGRLDYFQVLDQWEELDSSVRRGDKALFGWKLRNDGELARRPE
jgi:hypothetical protein